MLALLLLHGLQCMVRLSRGDLLFIRPLLDWRITAGPGWRPLHPIPSGACFLSSRFPLIEDEAGLAGREAITHFGLAPLRPSPLRFDPSAPAEVEARGKTVRVGGTPFLQSPNKRAAAAAAGLLRDLQGRSRDQIRERVARELAASLSLSAFREESERLRKITRLLAWSADSYALLLFVALPVAIWQLHAERALMLAVPVVLAAHLFTLGALLATARKVLPLHRGELFERLASCAIYPPGLLCALQELKQQAIGHFHPATVAAGLLEAERLRRLLRSELGRLEQEAALERDNANSFGLAALERDALAGLIAECGESPDALLAPPARDDPTAVAYCPLCLTDYRVAEAPCIDCGVALTRYPV